MAKAESQTRLSYKFQRLREQIRQAVLSGELSGKFPGERELAKKFEANAKTVSKALSDLMSEGLLVRQVGRGTYVRGDLRASHPIRRRRHYRWVVEGQADYTAHAEFFSLAKAEAAREGHRLVFDQLRSPARGELYTAWLPPSALKQIDGVVVHNSRTSPEFLADLARRHIPLVMADAGLLSFKTDTVRPDYARGAFELTEYLINLGHSHICLVLPVDAGAGGIDAVRGWQAAMARHELRTTPPCKAVREAVAQLLTRSSCPTALVVQGSVAEAVQSWNEELTPAGVRKPALAVLMQPGHKLVPASAVACYGFDPRPLVEWSIRLLNEASPGHSPREVVLPGCMRFPQQSAAPPAAASMPHAAVF